MEISFDEVRSALRARTVSDSEKERLLKTLQSLRGDHGLSTLQIKLLTPDYHDMLLQRQGSVLMQQVFDGICRFRGLRSPQFDHFSAFSHVLRRLKKSCQNSGSVDAIFDAALISKMMGAAIRITLVAENELDQEQLAAEVLRLLKDPLLDMLKAVPAELDLAEALYSLVGTMLSVLGSRVSEHGFANSETGGLFFDLLDNLSEASEQLEKYEESAANGLRKLIAHFESHLKEARVLVA